MELPHLPGKLNAVLPFCISSVISCSFQPYILRILNCFSPVPHPQKQLNPGIPQRMLLLAIPTCRCSKEPALSACLILGHMFLSLSSKLSSSLVRSVISKGSRVWTVVSCHGTSLTHSVCLCLCALLSTLCSHLRTLVSLIIGQEKALQVYSWLDLHSHWNVVSDA